MRRSKRCTNLPRSVRQSTSINHILAFATKHTTLIISHHEIKWRSRDTPWVAVLGYPGVGALESLCKGRKHSRDSHDKPQSLVWTWHHLVTSPPNLKSSVLSPLLPRWPSHPCPSRVGVHSRANHPPKGCSCRSLPIAAVEGCPPHRSAWPSASTSPELRRLGLRLWPPGDFSQKAKPLSRQNHRVGRLRSATLRLRSQSLMPVQDVWWRLRGSCMPLAYWRGFVASRVLVASRPKPLGFRV